MKALVYDAPNLLVFREVPDVFPKEGERKMRVKGCGICGSDVHGYVEKYIWTILQGLSHKGQVSVS